MQKNGKNELNNNIGGEKAKNNIYHAGKLADEKQPGKPYEIADSRRKIAFYIGSLHKGGAERVFINLAEYFLEQGYQVVMVTQYRKEHEYELAAGIERVISDITPRETTRNRVVNFLRRVGKRHPIWKNESPDLVL